MDSHVGRLFDADKDTVEKTRFGTAAAFAALLAAAGSSCVGDSSPQEQIGDAVQAVVDQPGDHGAQQRWVHCPTRIKEDVSDPLGPVLAHGFGEAPGFSVGLLDSAQKKFLRRSSLRLRDDSGPGSLFYEDLSLPSAPSPGEIASLVSGAIRLAGKPVPAPPDVSPAHLTSADDGLGHALPQMRIWDVRFRQAGAVVSGALCKLIAAAPDPEPCETTCVGSEERCQSGCAAVKERCELACDGDAACLKPCKKAAKDCTDGCKDADKSCGKICRDVAKISGTAALTCRLPQGTAPLVLEPFAATEQQATERARAALAPAFVAEWGSFGTAPGELNFPVAVDGIGGVYVADAGNDRIQRFDAGGGFVTEWGEHGSDPGQLDLPTGVTTDAVGNVYVSDLGNHRVQKFDSVGTFIAEWGSYGSSDGQFQGPSGIATGPLGDVYVSDRGNHRIQRFDAGGNFLGKWGSLGSGPGQFVDPADLAVDADGDVYVADAENMNVQRFSAAGSFVTSWGSLGSAPGELIKPLGVDVDGWGDVYVADSINDRIQKFTSTGVFLTSWGAAGQGPGEFESVRGVAVDVDGSVFAADSGNHRIQKFRTRPALVTSSKRYEIEGAAGRARYYVVLFDGLQSVGVHLDGDVTIRSAVPAESSFRFEGWDLTYNRSPSLEPRPASGQAEANDFSSDNPSFPPVLPLIGPALEPANPGDVLGPGLAHAARIPVGVDVGPSHPETKAYYGPTRTTIHPTSPPRTSPPGTTPSCRPSTTPVSCCAATRRPATPRSAARSAPRRPGPTRAARPTASTGASRHASAPRGSSPAIRATCL